MNDLIIADSYSKEQVQLIKDTCCRGASDDELKLFLYVAKKTGLDPLTKQIYSVGRWDSKLGREVRTNQTSIDGFRVIAGRTGRYAGQLGPFWCDEDGVWVDIWLKKHPPVAAKVGVLRTDFKEPLWGVALFSSYAQSFNSKQTGKMELSQFWKKFPDLMIAKCAESLALRKAFPQDLSGLVTEDEIGQDDEKQEELKRIITIENKPDVKADIHAMKNIKTDEENNIAKTNEEIKENIKHLLSSLTVKLKTPKDKIKFMADNLGINGWKEISVMETEELLKIESRLLGMDK